MHRARRIQRGVFACSLATGAALAQSGAETLLRAQKSFDLRDLDQAEVQTRQVLKDQPRSADAMYLLGKILEAEKKPQESLRFFTQAAALQAPHGEDLRVVAMDYVLLNAYPDALHWLARSVELDPANAEAWYDLGRARMQQGDLHGAREPLERALALKPGQAKVINNLGVVAEGENQPEKAATFYRQAIALETRNAHPSEQPMLNLGKLLLIQGKPAEALPLLLEAVRLAPADAGTHEQLAHAEEQQGQQKEAVTQLELAVHLQPKSAALHYQLGQLYRRAGLAEKARAELTLSGELYGTRSTGEDH